jgi:exopolysaccharide production protein ExoQ
MFGCALVVLVLFRINRDPNRRTSKALWIPVAWLLIIGSRSVSQWLGFAPADAEQAIVEGNPLDRLVYLGLLMAGVAVLLSRGRAVLALLRGNAVILLYFFYCGASVAWSDYPDVAFKRWIKALGDITMVLIVLSDPDWLTALKRVLTRAGFVLLPFSLVFDMFRQHSILNGAPHWIGLTLNKNTFGVDCLVFGLGSLWCFLEAYELRPQSGRSGPLLAYGSMVLLALLLVWEANSMTSLSCLLMSGTVMVLTAKPRTRMFIHAVVAAVLAVSFSALFLNVGSGLVENLGRDATLTGRTELWKQLVGMIVNPMFGAGFESFWLGQRLKTLWDTFPWRPNEAHNGYLEVLLNLGGIGVVILLYMMVRGYRTAVKAVVSHFRAGNLRLAFFVAAAAYSFTEAGFRQLDPIWIAALLAFTVICELPHEATADGPLKCGNVLMEPAQV